MLDWKVREDEPSPKQPLSDEGPDAPKRRDTASRRLWSYTIVVLLVMIAGAGGWVVWNRVQKGDEAMRRDLLAFIRREEQARRLGQQENAENFLADSGIPEDFAEAYTALFDAPVVPIGVEVALEEFELVGDTANVVVGLGVQQQRRTYRLTEAGWRRVPLQVEWGEEVRFVDAEQSVTIIARESDEAFARQFYEDLSGLIALLQAWEDTTEIPPGATLRIVPTELQGVMASYTTTETILTVNSPQVVELPHHWTLSGEAAVRYEIATWLLTPLRPSRPDIFATPQQPRLWDAARTVMAFRWAMPPEEYATVVEGWRTAALADGWQHPFDSFYTFDTELDPFAPLERQAEMLLVADTLYTDHGIDGMVSLFTATATAPSWDEAFRTATGDTTAALEARARGGAVIPSVAPLPLTGHLSPSVTLPLTLRGVPFIIEGMSTSVMVEGLMEATVEVQMGDGTRTTLPGSCAALFPSLTIEGTWMEEGMRLRADTLTVTDFPSALFTGTPPPPDAIAYLLVDAPVPEGEEPARHIVALLPDGTTTPMLTWSLPTMYSLPNAFTTGVDDKAIYLTSAVGDGSCPVVWFARYLPDKGIDGMWLVPLQMGAGYPRFLWDSVTNQGIVAFVNSMDMTTAYWEITPGDTTVLGEPDGALPYGDVQVLRPGLREVALLTDNFDDNNRALLRVEIGTGRTITSIPMGMEGYSNALAYDTTGRYLVTGMVTRDSVNPGVDRSVVTRYDLATGATDDLWFPAMGVVYGVFPDAHDPVWYATTFAPEAGSALYLLGQGTPRLLFTSTVEAMAVNLVACSSGGMVYVTAVPGAENGVSLPAESAFFMTRIAADATVVYADVPLPPNSGSIVCP